MLRIIFADDTPEILALYRRQLSRSSLSITAVMVKDGEELVNRVRNEAFHAIVTDYQMPKMDGLEAVRHIRSFDKVTPIYVISAKDVSEEAMAVGATGFFDKFSPLDSILTAAQQITQ